MELHVARPVLLLASLLADLSHSCSNRLTGGAPEDSRGGLRRHLLTREEAAGQAKGNRKPQLCPRTSIWVTDTVPSQSHMCTEHLLTMKATEAQLNPPPRKQRLLCSWPLQTVTRSSADVLVASSISVPHSPPTA